MEFKKELINHKWSNNHFRGILICEENKDLLIKLGADVFKAEKKKKYKGIKEDKPTDDNSNSESE